MDVSKGVLPNQDPSSGVRVISAFPDSSSGRSVPDVDTTWPTAMKPILAAKDTPIYRYRFQDQKVEGSSRTGVLRNLYLVPLSANFCFSHSFCVCCLKTASYFNHWSLHKSAAYLVRQHEQELMRHFIDSLCPIDNDDVTSKKLFFQSFLLHNNNWQKYFTLSRSL